MEQSMDRPVWQTEAGMAGKTALILLNMGGPDDLDAVQPFLCNLFSDRELIRLPGGAFLQRPFARLMARLRAPKTRRAYEAIGGASPLRRWTECQARGIGRLLGDEWQTAVIMRYWAPRADEVLNHLRRLGIQRAMVLSLYPHFTAATSGSSINDFCRQAVRLYPELDYRLIHEWFDWPPFLDALAHQIRQGLRKFAEERRKHVVLLFSAHALPEKLILEGDPYLDQVRSTMRGVLERLPGCRARLAFQSRSGPVRWIGPSVTETLDALLEEGCREVLMVPVSFVSDHVETLHEIDIEYRSYALQKGLDRFERVAAFNDDAGFLRAMAALVASRVPVSWLKCGQMENGASCQEAPS
jgi:ferrochelatase